MAEELENENSEQEPDTFPRSYVEELREEAKAHRLKASEAEQQAETMREAVRVAYLREGSRDVLAEPLEWSDGFTGEDGLPDPEKIREAAEAVALAKPHLARVAGGIPQGPQGEESETVSLADMLRAGA